ARDLLAQRLGEALGRRVGEALEPAGDLLAALADLRRRPALVLGDRHDRRLGVGLQRIEQRVALAPIAVIDALAEPDQLARAASLERVRVRGAQLIADLVTTDDQGRER